MAAAAYILRKALYDERTGKVYDYAAKEDLICSGVILPDGAPEIYKSPEKLFNSIELYEQSEAAKTAKKVIVALPREFDIETGKKVVESFIKETFADHGYAAVYSIHDKGDGNPHAHVLIAGRQIERDGSWAQFKERKEYALDKDGKRIPQLDKDGHQKLGKRNEKLWVRVRVRDNLLDRKDFLKEARESWAVQCNRCLEKTHQIDHRSFEDQGIERVPTIHEGYAAREIERKGGISDRCQENREIKEHNRMLEIALEKIRELERQLVELTKIFSREEREKRQRQRELERQQEQERSEYKELLYIAKEDRGRSLLEQLTEPMQLPRDPYIERLREENFRRLNEHIFEGVPLTDRYYEIETIVNAHDARQKNMYEAIKDGLERHLSGEDLYEYVQSEVAEELRAPEHHTQERDLERDEDEWER